MVYRESMRGSNNSRSAKSLYVRSHSHDVVFTQPLGDVAHHLGRAIGFASTRRIFTKSCSDIGRVLTTQHWISRSRIASAGRTVARQAGCRPAFLIAAAVEGLTLFNELRVSD